MVKVSGCGDEVSRRSGERVLGEALSEDLRTERGGGGGGGGYAHTVGKRFGRVAPGRVLQRICFNFEQCYGYLEVFYW